MKKLVIIDGNHMVWRAHFRSKKLDYKIKNHLTGDNDFGLVYMFLNLLLDTLIHEKPDYLLVVLDYRAKNFRHELCNKYKLKRKETPIEIVENFDKIMRLLTRLRIKWQSTKGFEGDDVIASQVAAIDTNKVKIKIISGDKDLYQLLGSNVEIYNPQIEKKSKRNYSADDFLKEYGFDHSRLCDYKILIGDQSDGISGLPYMPEDLASKIILKHKTFDEMMKTDLMYLGHSVGQNLIKNIDKINLNRKLVLMVDNLDVDSLDDLVYRVNSLELINYVHLMGFSKIINKIKKLEN